MVGRLCGLIIALGMGAATSADASDVMPGTQFEVRAWSGAAYSDSGAFSYCAISASYRGTSLLFAVSGNFQDFMVGMADNRWSLVGNTEVYATMSIDGIWTNKYKGIVAAANQVTFHFNPDPDFVRQLITGKTLTVATPKQTWRFNLVGTEASIPSLLGCVSQHSGDKNPFETVPAKNPFS